MLKTLAVLLGRTIKQIDSFCVGLLFSTYEECVFNLPFPSSPHLLDTPSLGVVGRIGGNRERTGGVQDLGAGEDVENRVTFRCMYVRKGRVYFSSQFRKCSPV